MQYDRLYLRKIRASTTSRVASRERLGREAHLAGDRRVERLDLEIPKNRRKFALAAWDAPVRLTDISLAGPDLNMPEVTVALEERAIMAHETMLKHLTFLIYMVFGLVWTGGVCHGTIRAQEFIKLSQKSDSALLKEGVELIDRDTLIDRAAACLTIVANNYYQNQTDTESRKSAVLALRHLGNIYMTQIIDYRKAYRYLVTAKEIAEEDKNDFELANIYVSLSNLYNVNSESSKKLEAESMNYLRKGFEKARSSQNETALIRTAYNLAATLMLQYNPEYLRILEETARYRFSASNKEKGHMVTVAEAVKAHLSKDYDKAEELFRKASAMPVYGRYGARIKYMVDLMLVDHYFATKQYDKAKILLREGLARASSRKNTDYELNYLARLVNTFEATGEKDSTDAYYTRYYRVADEFQREKGYNSIESMDFASEIEKINAQVEDLSVLRQKERQKYIIIIAALILGIVLGASGLVFHLVRKRNHRQLFRNQEEQMRREQDLQLLKTLETPIATRGSEEEPKDSSRSEASADRENLVTDFARILNVMENSEEIYRTGFSIADLASMLGISQRTASRAINVCRNCNFHQLLNEYRIRKVMRIMSENLSENFTIEWMAEKAGFKSRTHFTALFKKSTGLTPSEYLKMARERKNEE